MNAPVTPAPGEVVEIHYTRPPDRLTVFRQRLVYRAPDCVVTLMDRTPLRAPLVVAGRVVLRDGDPVVWFTFPDRWHDIGRFHVGDEFTGCYANILTPVRFRTPLVWETTDLFLDVWSGADGGAALLDEEELIAAERRGSVAQALARSAREEAAVLLEQARRGSWPPDIVREWPLERARAVLA